MCVILAVMFTSFGSCVHERECLKVVFLLLMYTRLYSLPCGICRLILSAVHHSLFVQIPLVASAE